ERPRNIMRPCSPSVPPCQLRYAPVSQKNQETANAIRKNGTGLYVVRASIAVFSVSEFLLGSTQEGKIRESVGLPR
ncbi:MAG: hypothetical protein LUO98_08405, partial [Methanoregula sp.]|nr:hypothetical protein [Methanoregula sp.]